MRNCRQQKKISMRSKSFLVRSARNSLHPNPSPASLPDEANEGAGSGVNTTQCDADVEVVPDTFDERDVPHKKRRLGRNETSRGGSKPLNLDACIVCEVSDERVIRCAGIGCLLSFHGECVNAEDLANSYCPYCWFKFLELKSESLREKVVEAEKARSKYLDKEMRSTDEDEVEESVPKSQEDTILSGDEDGNEEHSDEGTVIISDQELQGEMDAYSSKEEQVQVETMPLTEEIDQPEEDKGKLESGGMQEDITIDENEASEEEERLDTENFEDAEDDKDDEAAKDQTKVITRAGKKGDASPFLSMQESFSGKEQDQVKQNEKPRRRRRLVLKDIDSEISSNESTNERNGKDVTEKITSSAQVTSPSGKMKNQQGKLCETTKVAMPNTVRGITFFNNKDQRRRLYWTLKEEEMLKVGVEKFAAEANKNMPWRKILEMGKKVFHETRTPADLKDKWRNMIGRR